MLEDVVRKGELLDLYGSLLTEKQRSSMEMYYLADWSLGEIAEELSVSRQAVHDNLHRAGLGLEEYETKLRLLEKREKQAEVIVAIKEKLQSYGIYDEALTAMLDSLG